MTTLNLKLEEKSKVGRKIILKFEARHSSEAKFYRVMHKYKNRDFSCTFIFFSDSGRYLCVNAILLWGINTSYFIFCFKFMVNKKHGKQKIEKSGIYKRHFLYAQWKIIDGVKYVHCIKHAYKYLLREQVGFAAVLWRFFFNVFLVCSLFWIYTKVSRETSGLLSFQIEIDCLQRFLAFFWHHWRLDSCYPQG